MLCNYFGGPGFILLLSFSCVALLYIECFIEQTSFIHPRGQTGGNNEVVQTRFTKPPGWQANTSSLVSKIGKLTGRTIGPNSLLKVMAGDKFKANTYAWYKPTGMDNTTNTTLSAIVNNLLSQLTPGITGAAKGAAASQVTNGVLEPGVQNFLNTQAPASSAPKAYLNWVLLDEEQFKPVAGINGFVPVPQISGTMQKQLLQSNSGNDITITKNGYLYVYVSNESKGNVYFDDIRIEHTKGPLLEETHYYPFGSRLEGICSKAAGSLINKYQYNSKELQNNEFSDGSGLEWMDYGARMYDKQIGRWFGIDELAERFSSLTPYNYVTNNPINGIDPDGRDVIFLNDKNAVRIAGASFGHAAVIIGNSTDGWYYYSMNGTGDGSSPVGVSKNADVGTPLGNGNDVRQLILKANDINTQEEEPHNYDRYVRIKTTPEEDKAMKAKAAEAASKYWYVAKGSSCLDVSKTVFSTLVEGRDIKNRLHAQNLNSNPVPNTWMEALPWMFNYMNNNVNSSGSNYFQSPRKSLPVIIGPTTGKIIDEDKKQ